MGERIGSRWGLWVARAKLLCWAQHLRRGQVALLAGLHLFRMAYTMLTVAMTCRRGERVQAETEQGGAVSATASAVWLVGTTQQAWAGALRSAQAHEGLPHAACLTSVVPS